MRLMIDYLYMTKKTPWKGIILNIWRTLLLQIEFQSLLGKYNLMYL